MASSFSPRAVGRCLLPLFLVLLEFVRPECAWTAQQQKQVLVLYSTRRDAQIAIVGERELPRILESGLQEEGLDYYSEYLDLARFPDAFHQNTLRDFLRLKYSEQRFDVIIAMHELALEFLGKNRNDLFPGVPIVFFSSSPETQRVPNSAGVVARLNLSGTLTLATELQPDAQQVFVVSDDGRWERRARAQFQSFVPRLRITYLTGLPTKVLEERLATLPEHSIVYYVIVERDGLGEHFHPIDYLDRLTAVANAPIYSWVDSTMDHSIVGGSLKNQKAEMQAVGKLALRILDGEPADAIPVSLVDLNALQVDWRELRRWGISEARVPAGTLVRFKEPSPWDRYKVYMLGAAAVVLAQTGLIAGLLLQRSRRRKAEQQVRGSQAALRTSHVRIRDLGARLLNAQETERSRIARELHDDISQQMALLTIDLELLGARPDETSKLASEALDRANAIARSVHDLSHRLHPAKLRLMGLVPALHALQRELPQSQIPITFEHDAVPPTLPADLTLCLFRVVQEALQNALKYSDATEILVQLRGRPEGLSLTIADDGVGFDVKTAWGKGLGLISMAERLEAIGASLEMHSSPGAGTRFEVTVPLKLVQDTETPAL